MPSGLFASPPPGVRVDEMFHPGSREDEGMRLARSLWKRIARYPGRR
jgi:hypothetical protein